ncbi:uncharacterized protein ATNIH1004_003845 [Aspergillus tanneri]|uniref:glutathione transferase n=1 Tax=Aspergillus tanneri TaxID=1220188 RepID=A0A5M9MSV8_9EURO|nr:uncharacterized protein ATNIH1004_003845 [Aspergillus tanneri]KAA8647963.1 hypothetical protein ATNIH1004_003845 [Aspergillus tanneri]
MTFDPLANRLVFEMVFKPHFNTADPLPDDTLVGSLRRRLEGILDVLDGILGRQEFMAGKRLTLVDLFYIPYMHHLERSVWPGVLEWVQFDQLLYCKEEAEHLLAYNKVEASVQDLI